MRRIYKIHPGIGIARLGNSKTGWFDGPEVPDLDFRPAPNGLYRDDDHNIRRQAVRFRLYEYTYDDHTPPRVASVRRITAADAEVQWHVNLANLKSFTRDANISNRIPAPNDPGVQTLVGPNTRRDVTGRVLGADVQLGTLMTDAEATLRVLGGFGRSESPSGASLGGLFNAGWFDDVSDGPVWATIRLLNSGEMPPVEPAWVVVGVPRFAYPIVSVVTMYDVAYDLAVSHFGVEPLRDVSFTADIYPILQRAVFLQWADPDARRGHGPTGPANFLNPGQFALLRDNDSTPGSAARRAREHVFSHLKNPNGGGGDMPYLIGPPSPEAPNADGLTVTRHQYERFRRWSSGDFLADWQGEPITRPFEQLPALEQTLILDQTSLWTGVGGTFGPGIEVGRHFGEYQTFEGPLRIKRTLPPGYLTSTLSVPWQADYSACGTGWWPSGRPNSVSPDGSTFKEWARFAPGDDMLKAWWKLGFLAKRPLPGLMAAYLEAERRDPPPGG
jgi:hypothetical protein